MKKHPLDGAKARSRALRRDMTEAERRVWKFLRSKQVNRHKFRRQVPIGRYIADFVCHEMRLIVEIEGGQHDPSLPQEVERTVFLQGEGYRLLRLWNSEVFVNPDGVYPAISDALAGITPTQPSPIEGEGFWSESPR